MDPTFPQYINEDFLTKCLQCDPRYKDAIIVGYSSSFAAPAGNNYGSVVVRVTLDYKDEICSDQLHTLSLIVKGPHTEGPMRDMLAEYKVDINVSEPLFYNIFLPAAYKLLNRPFAPKTFTSPLPSVVVMEDLKQSGFVMADRTIQLDLAHCLMYTTAAAYFHAVSHALHKHNPDLINSICGANPYDEKMGGFMKKMFTYGLQCFADHVSDTRLSQTIKDSSTKLFHEYVEIHKLDETFNSLYQGDPWTTNMMFKYDGEGRVCDVKLLDFQNLLFGSPVHDLVFFVWSSANHDVRKNHLEHLYSSYFESLKSNLETLGCPSTMTYDTFRKIVHRFSPMALWTVAFLPGLVNPDPFDLQGLISTINDDSTTKGNPFEPNYNENYCQTYLPNLLEDMKQAGIFDYISNL